MKRKECLICGSKKLNKIIDLGMHPYADTFIDSSRQSDPLPIYNLSCVMCNNCKLIQTETITKADERYNLFDYSYTSSNSSTSKNHWREFCESISNKLSLDQNSTMCEIGSNEEESNRLLKNQGLSDIVIANNVYNHSDDPISFTTGVKNLLKEGGHYIFEVPYWKSTIDSRKVDQIYHEHVSYYTITSLKNLLEKCNFEIIEVKVVEYHGGSLRVIARKNTSEKLFHYDDITSQIKEESYLFQNQTYEILNKELSSRKIEFLSDLYKYKKEGYNIIAIGAAAKGNTLLNFLNLNNSLVDYVTDTSTYKQGKKTPLSDIEICGDEIFSTFDKVCGLILSWNLTEPIKNKIRQINPNIKYINFYE